MPKVSDRSKSADSRLLVSLKHCSVLFEDHRALHDVSFELRAGERWVLMGPNGAGKSVFLKLLRGDMWPTPTGREQRRYALTGRPTSEPRGSKQYIAYLAPERQDRYVRYDWNLTVTQIVTTGIFDEDIPLTAPNAAQQRRVASLLRRFQLWSLRERRMLSLSYGQRRRVLLARALAAEPKVLLLDEPFNGLDAPSRRILQRSLDKLSRDGMTWILSTHRMLDVPKHATHFARMENGRIVHSARYRPQALKQSPAQRSSVPLPRNLPGTDRFLGRNSRAVRSWNLSPMPVGERVRERGAAPSTAPLPGPLPAKAGRGDGSRRARARHDGTLVQLSDVQLFRDYRPVLKKFDWQIRRGEHWAIMGRNGSGKSSLLLMLYGDLHPALGGRIRRDGMKKGEHIARWKKRVGFVSPELQADHFRAGTLEEIVASGRYASVGLNDAMTAADRRHARKWLQFFGLESLAGRRPRQVSYGQMRLSLIARAMVNEPELLLLDEPFTGLDPDIHAQVSAFIQRLAEQGTQIVMALHDKHDIVPAIGQILTIERGGDVAFKRVASAVRQS